LENLQILASLLPDYAIKIGVALLCGVMLGLERERREKPAGLRTIVMITVGATIYMIISELIPHVAEGSGEVVQSDPARVAAQVVTGIGFLGAGTIIQSRGSVHGLTTAAVIWVAAAIGLCIGVGFPITAILFTIVVIVSLVVLTKLRRRLVRQGTEYKLVLFSQNDTLHVQLVRSILESAGAVVTRFDVTRQSDDELQYNIGYFISDDASAGLYETLIRVEGVHGEKFSATTG